MARNNNSYRITIDRLSHSSCRFWISHKLRYLLICCGLSKWNSGKSLPNVFLKSSLPIVFDSSFLFFHPMVETIFYSQNPHVKHVYHLFVSSKIPKVTGKNPQTYYGRPIEKGWTNL